MTITGNCNDAIYGGRCLIDAKSISAWAEGAGRRFVSHLHSSACLLFGVPCPLACQPLVRLPFSPYTKPHPLFLSVCSGRIFHADNSGFLPSFYVTFENIRFTGGMAAGLGGAFYNQGKMQVRAGWVWSRVDGCCDEAARSVWEQGLGGSQGRMP